MFNNGKEVFTDSEVLARECGVEHCSIKLLIKAHQEELNEVCELRFQIGTRDIKKSRKIVTQLDESQAIYLLMVMRGNETAKKFRITLIKQFKAQKKLLNRFVSQRGENSWQVVREISKKAQQKKTDVFKKFVEYAVDQGSGSPQWYYKLITNQENKALFPSEEKFLNTRDVMSEEQLIFQISTNQISEKALIDGMKQGMFYKDIFKLVGSRLETYAELVGNKPITTIDIKG